MRVEEVSLAAEKMDAEGAVGAEASASLEMLEVVAVIATRHPEHHQQHAPCPWAPLMRVQKCTPQQLKQPQQPWSIE